MACLPVMPRLRCANDPGGRYTLFPSGDAHRTHRISVEAAASYASAATPVSTARAAPTGKGATPQAEGLVRARGPACFHTLAPAPSGSLPIINPSREGHRAPLKARRISSPTDPQSSCRASLSKTEAGWQWPSPRHRAIAHSITDSWPREKMTTVQKEKIARRKLSLLQLAQELMVSR